MPCKDFFPSEGLFLRLKLGESQRQKEQEKAASFGDSHLWKSDSLQGPIACFLFKVE
jgi:hypothetical protein